MTQEAGGEPTYGGQFVTPGSPNGKDGKDLTPDEKAALKKLFDAEVKDVDEFHRRSTEHARAVRPNDSRGNFIGSLIPMTLALDVPARITAGQPAAFAAQATTPFGPTRVVHWTWDFGNGKTANQASASTVFDHSGSYLITVSARDYAGARGSISRYVDVLPAGPEPPSTHLDVSTATADGMTTYTFATPNKTQRVLVYTTDDLTLGDAYVVGHVSAEATGANQDELAKNTAEVTGDVVELGNGQTTARNKTLLTSIPIAVAGGALRLLVRNPKGSEVGRVTVPVRRPPQTFTAPVDLKPSDYNLPQFGIAGRPAVAEGFFTESTRASIGGRALQPFVASPRKYVVLSPTDQIGKTAFTIEQGNVTKTVPFVNLAVETQIDASQLTRQQSTTMRVVVRGLPQDQKTTLNLRNLSPGVITIEGGDNQPLVFGPGGIPVRADGTATVSRNVKATRAGAFHVDVTLPPSQARPGG
jgi:PKD repeat protein